MVSACLDAYRTTSDSWWYGQAQRAFDWFLGWNDLGLELHSPSTGGCRDALHVDRVNGNQGAESTLAFLLSLAEMRLAQHAMAVFHDLGIGVPWLPDEAHHRQAQQRQALPGPHAHAASLPCHERPARHHFRVFGGRFT